MINIFFYDIFCCHGFIQNHISKTFYMVGEIDFRVNLFQSSRHLKLQYFAFIELKHISTGERARGDARAVRRDHGPHGGGDDLRGRGGRGGLLPGGEINT